MSDNYDGPQMAQKILRQQTEIKRLRDSLVIANTTRANLHSEINRLRALLREALEDGYIRVPYGASHEDVSAILDFEKRIREAI